MPETNVHNFLKACNPDAIDYVKEFKDKVDNLIVVKFENDDWVEVDKSAEFSKLEYTYVAFGIDEGIIDGCEEFESIYHALCAIE